MKPDVLQLATSLRHIVCLAVLALVRKLQKFEHTHTHAHTQSLSLSLSLSLKNAISYLVRVHLSATLLARIIIQRLDDAVLEYNFTS